MSFKKFSKSFFDGYGIDAHEVKEDYGCRPWAHFDIYNGDTVTIRDKKGNLKADTGMTKEEFIEAYRTEKGRGKYE